MRDHWHRGHAVIRLNDGLDVVSRQHFKSAALRRPRKRVRILAHVKRAMDILHLAIIANRLRDREDVCFVESSTQRSAAMSARAEADELCGISQLRLPLVVFAFQLCYVDKNAFGSRFTGQWRKGHLSFAMSEVLVRDRFIQYEGV